GPLDAALDTSAASEPVFDTPGDAAVQAAFPGLDAPSSPLGATAPGETVWIRMGREVMTGLQTLVSAAVYATLIVTFGVQVARVDGLSMAPTLEDHDRLIVNKLV